MGNFNRSIFVTAAGATAFILVSVADAADPVVDATQLYEWSGLYLGVHGGFGQGSRDYDDDAGIFTGSGEFDYDLKGSHFGAQAGFNHQVNNIVFGIEGDASWSDMRDSEVEAFGFITAESEVNWLATIRGRAGIAWDRFLVYGTGGIAFAEVDTEVNTIFVGRDSDSATHTGWAAGLGIEGMVTEHVSLKLEYLHADFGDEGFTYYSGGPGSVGEAGLELDIFRLGMNLQF